MAIYQVTRTSTPLNAPAAGSLLPGQLAVEMATQPSPRMWVGVPTTIDPTGRRLLVSSTGGGGGGIPDAPTDGQIYGRDGETETWVPVLPLAGGAMLGPLTLNANATLPLGAVPLQQLNSELGQFLQLSGGTMTGNLILDGPPSSGSNVNQAATVGYVDSLITGAVQFIGTMNATTGIVTYTASSGLPSPPGGGQGALVPASQAKDDYVICAVAGTVPSGSIIAGAVLNVGDWIISDGTTWTTIAVSGEEVLAQNVAVSPTILGQSNTQTALQALLTNFGLYAPINSPGFTGIPTAPNPPIADSSQAVATTAWVNAQGYLAGITLSGDVNGAPSINLDGVIITQDISGAVNVASTGDFLDQLTLAGDSTGASTSTLPAFITAVTLTSPDATSTTITV